VNGDFFAARGIKDAEGTNSAYRSAVWSRVVGAAMTDGREWSSSTNNRPCLVVHKDHSVAIESRSKPEPDDWEVISGNTMLVAEAKVIPHTNKARHPRTAVGLDATRKTLILLVTDGRKPGIAIGMSYDELAAEMVRLGCREALNLDGGGSSVMAVRGAGSKDLKILNQPTDGKERAVANVLGITIDQP
jgi:exopolysaccharide biosynthesis protein